MTTTITVLVLVFILAVGFITIYRRYLKYQDDLDFALDYRGKFIKFTNRYFKHYNDEFDPQVKIDIDLYNWLMKNSDKIQLALGVFGTMHYVHRRRGLHVPNYQIILNTIPKFSTGQVENIDITSSENSLLRYIGEMERAVASIQRSFKNPFIWFKEGVQEIISLPMYILNWFGLMSEGTVGAVRASTVFSALAGIAALVAFLSGVVTIIQGYDQTVTLFKQLLRF